MSKLTKLIKTPILFFLDSRKKKLGLSLDLLLEKKLNKDIFKQISNFSHSYTVNSIKVDNEYIWPYLRSHLWINLNYLSISGNRCYQTINPFGVQIGHAVNLPYFKRQELSEKYNISEIEEIKVSTSAEDSIDFLFLTSLNAAEQVVLEDKKIYNRISDPLLERAEKLGVSKRLEMVKANTPSLKKVQNYKHKPLLVFPPSLTKSGYFEKLILHRFFYSTFRSRVPSQILDEKIMHELVDWEMHTRDYCIELLKRLSPKVLIFNGFHYYGPMISAADSLGIVTVDVQHGLQVGWNPLYNSWDEMPKEGYSSLPDFFAVWGKKEYDNIKETFYGEKHEPVILGNLWLQRQINEQKNMSRSFLKNIGGYKVKVLLAMQNQGEIPVFFRELIEKASDDIVWIIRHHPKGSKFKVNAFSATNKNILLTNEIDGASWSQLLPNIDVTVSEGSAVALEADFFGSYNVITSPEGKDNYQKEIECGSFYYVESNPDEFFDILNELDLSDRRPKANTFEEVDVDNVLNLFLEKYRLKQSLKGNNAR